LMLSAIIFAIFAVIAILSGVMVVTARNPVKAVLSLIVAFVATAGSWMLLQAEFLSLVLIVVYVGAVMVLFLFVVMMLDVVHAEEKASFVTYWPFAGVLGVLLFTVLINLIGNFPLAAPTNAWNFADSNVLQVGIHLFTDSVFPLEVAAVILLVAMISAIALTFRGRSASVKSQKISAQVKVRAQDRLTLVDLPSETMVKPEIQIEASDSEVEVQPDSAKGEQA